MDVDIQPSCAQFHWQHRCVGYIIPFRCGGGGNRRLELVNHSSLITCCSSNELQQPSLSSSFIIVIDQQTMKSLIAPWSYRTCTIKFANSVQCMFAQPKYVEAPIKRGVSRVHATKQINFAQQNRNGKCKTKKIIIKLLTTNINNETLHLRAQVYRDTLVKYIRVYILQFVRASKRERGVEQERKEHEGTGKQGGISREREREKHSVQ